MAEKRPVGIENFEKILTEGCLYVDKTGLIKELLNSLKLHGNAAAL